MFSTYIAHLYLHFQDYILRRSQNNLFYMTLSILFFLQLYLLSVPFIIISFQTRIYFDCFFPISPIKTYNSYGHEFYLFCLLICHLSFVGDLFVFGSETANRVDCVVFWAYSEEEVRGTQR